MPATYSLGQMLDLNDSTISILPSSVLKECVRRRWMHVFVMTLILFKNKKHLPSGICYGKTLKINNFLKREKGRKICN